MKNSENPLTTANVLDIQIELLSFSEEANIFQPIYK